MGLFIEVKIDQSKFATLEERERCARVCPVDALKAEADGLKVDSENEDECTLCYLCQEYAPSGAIRVVKTYQEWLK